MLDEYTKRGLVALFFYPGNWSSVCTDQVGRFEEKGESVLVVRADTPWSHRAFAADRGIEFPLLADFDREVIQAYEVKRETGFTDLAYFVIDREEIGRAKRVETSPQEQPEVEAVFEDLDQGL